MVGTTWMGEFAGLGGLDPTPSNIDGSQFFEGAWNTTVVDGTSYAVPWYVETRLVYYRTDLAEEGGVTEPPATWDELKALAEGIQGAGRAVWDQPPAGRNRLVADLHAVLLAGRRRDHGRERQLHARLRGVRRGADLLRLLLRGGPDGARSRATCRSRASSPTATSARSSADRG